MEEEKKGYKDPSLPIPERIKDLLKKMTLEEKIGQMMTFDGNHEDPVYLIEKYHVGSLFYVKGTKAETTITAARKTRLGIPVLLGIDSIHGYSYWKGSTIFPSQLGLSCSFSPPAATAMGTVTAKEMQYTGPSWTFSPVLGIARDIRWGRIDETFGEDPYLVGSLGRAIVRGYQGDSLNTDPSRICACLKHYVGYTGSEGGKDAAEAEITHRMLKAYFLPPFEMVQEGGDPGSYMVSYQAIDGVPLTLNKYLIKDYLRGEMGFDGLLVTDYNNIESLVYKQKVCEDLSEATRLSIQSGCDMSMQTHGFYEAMLSNYNSGLISLEEIESCVSNILRVKFKLGLFENDRYPDLVKAKEVIGSKEHREVALAAARISIVLLKNQDNTLPLPPTEPNLKVGVIGPNADDAKAQLGDWTLGVGDPTGSQPRELTITTLDGVKAICQGEVGYAKGCGIVPGETASLEEAVRLSSRVDVVVLVLGDRYMYVGEFKPMAECELMGGQKQLLQAMLSTGTPVVLVLVNSKPLILPDIASNCPAIIQTFNMGMLGGQALAEIIFGRINPSGKLSITMPKCIGQQPVYYYRNRSQHGKYADIDEAPLYPFGHGLSYTTYNYIGIATNKVNYNMNDVVEITISIQNTGGVGGEEIVLLFVKDLISSSTWADMLLKGFSRVALEAGEFKNVQFLIPVSQLWIVNRKGQRVVEPGEFTIFGGGSSDKQKLIKVNITVEKE